jgi:hypothetical protein
MTRGVTLQAITVDLAVLRSAQVDTVLRPGMVLGGRVTERVGAHGLLLLHGAPVVARLPPGVEAGARLRLQVAEAAGDSVVLQILPDAPGAAVAVVPSAAFALALPGGLQAQLRVDRDGGQDGDGPSTRGGGATISLRLDSPAMGRMDLRLDAGTCAVHVSVGPPSFAAQAAAGELRSALAAVTGRDVLVTIHPRTTSAIDVSA